MSGAKFENTQRLLNLVFALIAAGRNGISKATIFSTVPGFEGMDPDDDADDKLFNREKNYIREIGINIVESRASYADGEDTYKYAIVEESFKWPDGFFLTSEQSRLLELAANCWKNSSVDLNLNHGLQRLIALGEAPDRTKLAELMPSFRPVDLSFGPLASSINEQSTVRFKYRKPNNEIEIRTLSPWRFLNIEGQWLVQGWCDDRKDIRNFMLKRIVDKKVSAPRGNTVEYVPQTSDLIARADKELEEFRAANTAVVKVQRDTAAWSHFEMDFEATDEKLIRFMDQELLAIQLRRYAGQLEVISPAEVRSEVLLGLEKVVNIHA